MLGWDIFVTAINANGKKITIASWSTGIGGCQWLEDLVKQGQAKYLGGNGYPNRYSLPFSVLLDKIIPLPPSGNAPLAMGDDYVSDSSHSNFELHDGVILDIDSNTMVEVEIWDQS